MAPGQHRLFRYIDGTFCVHSLLAVPWEVCSGRMQRLHAPVMLCDPCRGWARSSCSTAVLHTIHSCCGPLHYKWAYCGQRWPASDSRPSGENAHTIQLQLTIYIHLPHSLSNVTLKSSFSESRTTCCRVSVAASGKNLKSSLWSPCGIHEVCPMQDLIKEHRACSERLCKYLPEWWQTGNKP